MQRPAYIKLKRGDFMLFLHTAKNGDDINEIAERFRTTPEDIKFPDGQQI